MDVREKLVDLLDDMQRSGTGYFGNAIENKKIADHLIANGVTLQELDGCEHCRTASYTEKPFIVITQIGGEVKTQFNFCPNCGRRLPQPPKGE